MQNDEMFLLELRAFLRWKNVFGGEKWLFEVEMGIGCGIWGYQRGFLGGIPRHSASFRFDTPGTLGGLLGNVKWEGSTGFGSFARGECRVGGWLRCAP